MAEPFISPLTPGFNVEEHVAKTTDRTCGDCQMCCKFTGINALKKPRGVMCKHAEAHRCNIYEQRPECCHTFYCSWRMGMYEDEGRPDKIGVFSFFKPGNDNPEEVWCQIVVCMHDKERMTVERFLIVDNIVRGLEGVVQHFAIYHGGGVLVIRPDGVFKGRVNRIKGEFEEEIVPRLERIGDRWDSGPR